MHFVFTGKAHRKKSDFKSDPKIEDIFTSNNGDYWNSGWSRGHMAPAGDNKHDQVCAVKIKKSSIIS